MENPYSFPVTERVRILNVIVEEINNFLGVYLVKIRLKTSMKVPP
ncbi:hypothetical protein CWATWH0402_917 [Crocosphaera watsonii WH 0402]|uniref:Uncharacterized protein n=4 Tax=Crocosphaera watsonii TaxID=263511 RepID=T2JKQ5_CROWT|nr:hypothetical protein CWATWH0003_1315 [Crocosphaera watsonii WH 0003]CCQ54316.1 hypothetical protein CWATWH0005_1307 [Crocosphaera watsonii WH 0005]CCQ59638.1 hypothetical protein CWATWH0401_4288 [Crocosphaera watsonii WH 0401]CCQ66408.1 hypothetical protein CWATWH0402_917 [Crocosphaera watsonii WH 0402]